MPGPWNRLTVAMTTVAVLLAGLAAWGWLAPQPALQPTRAVVDFGDITLRAQNEIVVSPDGSRLAVAGTVDGQEGLYWRDAAGEDFRLIPGTEGDVRFVSFSPDADWLTYTDGQALLRVAISGGAPRPVVQSGNPRDNHWGDDGTIVFNPGSGLGLYRVPDTGGEPEVLLESTPVRNPRLLPGGQAVIFTDPRASSTYLLDLRTDSVIELILGGIDAMYVETGHLLYADLAGGLWAVEFNVGRGEVVGDAVPVLDGLSVLGGQWARYSVSRNGTLVYGAGASGGGGIGRLTTVGLDGTVEVEDLAAGLFGRPQWSPNGRFVVYSNLEPGETEAQKIYTYDMVAKSRPRRLTVEGDNRWPVWSPDGGRVAFGSAREGTDGLDLYVKTVDDDAPPQLLISLPGDQPPNDWPTDDALLFNGPGRSLWIADLGEWATTDSVAVEPYIAGPQEPASLAPQGDLVVYSTTVGSNWEVFVRSFPESRLPEKVSEGGGDYPVWSADGNTIYYLNSPGEDTLYAARIERGPPFVVIESAPVMPWDFDVRFDPHPDGDRFITVQPIETGSGGERTFLVVNWFEELRERLGN